MTSVVSSFRRGLAQK